MKQAAEIGDLGTLKDLIEASLTQTLTDLLTSLAKIACSKGHLNVLQYLVEDLSVDINSVTTNEVIGSTLMPSGSSLLQISIVHDQSFGHHEYSVGATANTFNCIEWLTRNGANTHQKNIAGEDALATARRTKHLQALGFLSWSLLDKHLGGFKYRSSPDLRKFDFDAYYVINSSRDVSPFLLRAAWAACHKLSRALY